MIFYVPRNREISPKPHSSYLHIFSIKWNNIRRDNEGKGGQGKASNCQFSIPEKEILGLVFGVSENSLTKLRKSSPSIVSFSIKISVMRSIA